jgi:hypothetical protein
MCAVVNLGRMDGGEMPNDEERLRVRALRLRTWVKLVDK